MSECSQHFSTILPEALIDMGRYEGHEPIKIDVVYAQAAHPENIFKTALYRADAKLWLHQDLAEIVVKAAQLCHERHGYIFVLRDGLRPIEAQAGMQETEIVKAHPEWCREPDRLLSNPGQGGHPRGMAIDITLETENGQVVPMGTGFDSFDKKPCGMPVAHRENNDLPDDILANRKILETAMVDAAVYFGREILPLPQEWWDFRFRADVVMQYAPLSDYDLPNGMKVVNL